MKKIIFIIVINFVFSNLVFSQDNYKYLIFELNTKVSFNDLLNFYGDDITLTTKPSVYLTGEDIIFTDRYGWKYEYSYFENTQILQSISVTFQTDFSYSQLQSIWSGIVDQLGNPTKGYVVKNTLTYFIYQNSTPSISYAAHYEYCYKDYSMDFYYDDHTAYGYYKFSAFYHKTPCSYSADPSRFYPHDNKTSSYTEKVEIIEKY